jgi:hypothetical protein
MKQAPNTVEEVINYMDQLFNDYGTIDDVPFEAAMIPTHRMFFDLCVRIILLETKLEARHWQDGLQRQGRVQRLLGEWPQTR